jgi:hypothetical protein
MRIAFAILLVANLVLGTLGFLSWRQQAGDDAQTAGAAADEGGIRIVQGEPEPVPPAQDAAAETPASGPTDGAPEGAADAAAGEAPAPADATATPGTPPAPPSAAVNGAKPVAESACIEIAPLSQEELARIRTALGTLGLEDRTTVASVPATASWWVYIPPKSSREQADKEVLRLNAAGIRDTYVVQEQSDMRHAISLGIFRTRDAAERFAEGVKAKGVRNVSVDARPLQIRMSAVFVRDPDPAQTQRLLELKALFPGADIRASTCPG